MFIMAGLVNAVVENRPRQVILHLKLGADVNLRSVSNKTPLMLACYISPETAALKMAKLLIKYGATTRLFDDRKRNALMHAVLTDKTSVVDYIVSENSGNLDLNASDSDQNTALHLAAGIQRNISVVKTLVKAMRKYQLSLSKRNSHGRTPLMEAIVNNNPEIEQFLREVLTSQNVPKEVFVSSAFVSCNKSKSNFLLTAKRQNTTISKFTRSKTLPVTSNGGRNQEVNKQAQLSKETRSSQSMYCRGKENGITDGITLTKLYEIWQDQLSSSYHRSAVPVYEEYVPAELPNNIPSFTNTWATRSVPDFVYDLPVCNTASQFQRSKSSMELGYRVPQSHNFTGEHTLSVNRGIEFSRSSLSSGHCKHTAQGGKGLSVSRLQVLPERRSRSASPRPLAVLFS